MRLKITIESIQYTPGGEPVIVQYSADGNGPMARTTMFHTTQAELGEGWNDKHVLEALEAHLGKFELPAEVPMAIELRAAGKVSVPTSAEEVIASVELASGDSVA